MFCCRLSSNISYIVLLIVLNSTQVIFTQKSKIVALLPARNESHILAQHLQALALYTDAIVYLDDASDDNSISVVESLAQACNIERIIKKETWYRDEPGDKNKLLNAGREIGGTHFIFLDADEMFTSNCLDNNFLRERILNLLPGEKINLVWIQLWRSIDRYRFDKSIWTWNYKPFIFCDDGKCSYNSGFIHTSRVPTNLSGKTYTIPGYEHGVLHFQFVNWRNLLIKQSWYRCLERIRDPKKTIKNINKLYAPSKNEKNLKTSPAPKKWFNNYHFFKSSTYDFVEKWRETQVVSWFEKYGTGFFKGLDIWDVDWGAGLV